jgi:hypothetical protein
MSCPNCPVYQATIKRLTLLARMFNKVPASLDGFLGPFEGVELVCPFKLRNGSELPRPSIYRSGYVPAKNVNEYDKLDDYDVDLWHDSVGHFKVAHDIRIKDSSTFNASEAKASHMFPRQYLAKFTEDKLIAYAISVMTPDRFRLMLDNYARVATLLFEYQRLTSPTKDLYELRMVQPVVRLLLRAHLRSLGSSGKVVEWDSAVTLVAKLPLNKDDEQREGEEEPFPAMVIRGKPDSATLVAVVQEQAAVPATASPAPATLHAEDKVSKMKRIQDFKTAEDYRAFLDAEALRHAPYLDSVDLMAEVKPPKFAKSKKSKPLEMGKPPQSAIATPKTRHQASSYLVGLQQGATHHKPHKCLITDVVSSRLVVLLDCPGRSVCWASPATTSIEGTCALNTLSLHCSAEEITNLMRSWCAESDHPMAAEHQNRHSTPPTGAGTTTVVAAGPQLQSPLAASPVAEAVPATSSHASETADSASQAVEANLASTMAAQLSV